MKRILVIEDNQEIRENMSEILELNNYLVDTADNGKKGVELALLHRPNLVLCDIMMPVLDGYGVLLDLQKNRATQHIPFIFMTARSENNEIRKGMECGADDYITKPFIATDILNVIERRLRKADSLLEELSHGNSAISDLIGISNRTDCMERLKENRHFNSYKKKHVIYTEGNLPSKLFYILKGKVKTYKRNKDGKELILHLYNEGDFIGYMPLLENTLYMESAEALEDTQLAIIPRLEFEELLSSNSQVMKNFVSVLAKNLREMEEHLLAIAYNSLRKKVADTLLLIYEKYNPQKYEHFEIDLTRDNLAAIAGVAKESLIRMLGEFRDEQLICITNSVIKIKDVNKLQQISN